MEIKATILPGQNGTKQLLRQYGEQLVCVRYRYDKARLKRFKTVELIVEEKEWIPQDYVRSDRLASISTALGSANIERRSDDVDQYKRYRLGAQMHASLLLSGYF